MKRILLIVFALTIALMSWEGQKAQANLVDQGPIPQQSIRLRIIANSDSIQDQWLKREVRDEIVKQMNTWVTSIERYEDAVGLVEKKLPELEALVEKTIRDRGFSYTAQVDFGQVPFPTKQYGSYIYPAGNYQALRVRIGEAKGQNWWCVLFPPLCFIDMSNGDAVQARERKEETPTAAQALPIATAEVIAPEIAETQPSSEAQPEQIVEPVEESTESAPESGEAYEKRARFLQWKEQRFIDQAEHVDVAVDNSAEAQVAAITPSAPAVEVRFYLLDRLAAWF
ncbi:stage II sporulation protein R [Brevibacillus migulae]|uniref:stage II sporulation protein R n=1 Tax=Brevibacillus migulae TaxID=1644114 RepID=UPI00106E15A1|nr:stage II sporulation protein R [Brevibacillus migulae]